MKAEEARKLSEEKQIKFDAALKIIKQQAEYGSTSCLFQNLHKDTIEDLMRLGYKLSIHTDPMGIERHVCNW